MKLANVEGERREAQPGLSAKCCVCGAAMISKCGALRIWHWAHQGTRSCDHWWEPETAWHRAWKDHFPKDQQEIVQLSQNGEKHIADVKTAHGVVLEFQHSFLNREERQSREAFYPNLVWVIDGRRRALDMPRFSEALKAAVVLQHEPRIISVDSNRCALLRDWNASRVPVYFDFGHDDLLWRLDPVRRSGGAHLLAMPKRLFLAAHLRGQPLEKMCTHAVDSARYSYFLRTSLARPLGGFERFMARRQRVRRRF